MQAEDRSTTPIRRPVTDVAERRRRTWRGRVSWAFGALSNRVAVTVGSPWAFGLALLAIIAWALSGPALGYSDSWQLTINTGTTIVTFLIVFLIQHTQNKDARAIQIKLNELLAAVEGASNRLINVEEMTDEELDRLRAQFQALVRHIRARGDAAHAHSIEEENGRPAADDTAG
jgi:low affinity Fe/Cu permease